LGGGWGGFGGGLRGGWGGVGFRGPSKGAQLWGGGPPDPGPWGSGSCLFSVPLQQMPQQSRRRRYNPSDSRYWGGTAMAQNSCLWFSSFSTHSQQSLLQGSWGAKRSNVDICRF
jgi:hypothetical protein